MENFGKEENHLKSYCPIAIAPYLLSFNIITAFCMLTFRVCRELCVICLTFTPHYPINMAPCLLILLCNY